MEKIKKIWGTSLKKGIKLIFRFLISIIKWMLISLISTIVIIAIDYIRVTKGDLSKQVNLNLIFSYRNLIIFVLTLGIYSMFMGAINYIMQSDRRKIKRNMIYDDEENISLELVLAKVHKPSINIDIKYWRNDSFLPSMINRNILINYNESNKTYRCIKSKFLFPFMLLELIPITIIMLCYSVAPMKIESGIVLNVIILVSIVLSFTINFIMEGIVFNE